MSEMILNGWTSIGTASNGTPYGHVPGNHFHDIDVEISQKGDRYRVAIREKSGSAQGRDEVHYSNTVVARGDSISATCSEAKSLAIEADFDRKLLVKALSEAADEAEENSESEPAPKR